MPIDSEAADFLKYAFTESKDLAKQFLTVVTAVLVFSLTFSEKIARFESATRRLRLTIAGSWCLMLLSIILCGIGICFIALSGGVASSGGAPREYWSKMNSAILCLGVGGLAFLVSLITLLVAAVMSSFSH